MNARFKSLPCWLLCPLLFGVGGCQLIALVDKIGPDPVDPAKYVPQQDNMLVLVEDFQNPALIEVEAEHMNRLIAEELVPHKVAPIVNPDRLSAFRSDHMDGYRQMKIPAIGSELGARQVLYADITEFTVESASGTDVRRGHAEVRVKVVDSTTGQTRWPRDGTAAGFPIVIDIPFAAETQNVTTTEMRGALARRLSSRIAKLFYNAVIPDHEIAPSYPETDAQ